ncbi:hypothetical protein ACHAXM_003560 [Skeletonema potamos]
MISDSVLTWCNNSNSSTNTNNNNRIYTPRTRSYHESRRNSSSSSKRRSCRRSLFDAQAEGLRDTLRNQQGGAISRRDLLLQDGEPNPMSIRSMNSLALFMSGRKMKTQRLNQSAIQEEDEEEVPEAEDIETAAPKKGCCNKFWGVLDEYPLTFIIGGALIGMGIGVGLVYWKPAVPADKATAILWIGLLGELFIRALKCIVLPLVFVSIAVSVMDMLALGEAGSIVGTTIGLYVFTTICAALIGCLVSALFANLYVLKDDGVGEGVDPDVRIGCSLDAYEDPQSFLTQQADGSVVCAAGGSGNNTVFFMDDINGYFQKSAAASGPAKLSISQGLYESLFMQLIGTNMLGLFTSGNFLGVIVLGAGFGVALVQLQKDMPPEVKWDKILTIQVIEEVMQVFMKFVNWIIKLTPFAIMSLIAAAVGAQTDLAVVFSQIGALIAAILVGILLQVSVVYSGLYTLFVRKNPLKYYKHLFPAWMMAFASASSAATIPISLECAVSSGEVPVGVARFVIPLGATINMDGTAINILSSCIWLAYQNGIVPTAGDYILLVIAATVGSMGAAPVPAAGLVMIRKYHVLFSKNCKHVDADVAAESREKLIAFPFVCVCHCLSVVAYSTAFGSTESKIPDGMAYLVAIDWFVDRFCTMGNVTGDLVVTGIVANKVKKKLDETVSGSIGEFDKEK